MPANSRWDLIRGFKGLTCRRDWQSLPRSHVGKRSWFHILRNSHIRQQVAVRYKLPQVQTVSIHYAIRTLVGNVLLLQSPKP